MEKPSRPTTMSPLLLLPKNTQHVATLVQWAILALVMGTFSALVVYGVREVLLVLASLRDFSPAPLFFALLVFGGLINGLFIFRMEREARGDGINTYIKTSWKPEFQVRTRFPFLKILATFATLGSGARGGLVGPLVSINAGFGVVLTRWISPLGKLAKDYGTNLRVCAICGAAGAVGALFMAPLGAGIFAVEILFGGSLAYRALFPAILTSTVAFFASTVLGSEQPLSFWTRIPFSAHMDAGHILLVIITAIAAGLLGILFVYANKRLPSLLEQRKIPPVLRPAMGGLFCGILAAFLGREILFPGSGLFTRELPEMLAIPHTLATARLLLLLVGICLATSFTVGSGGSGGLTMPAMTLGALCGAVIASAYSIEPVAALPLLLAGMTACLASSLNIPIAAAVLSIEIFGTGAAYACVLGSVIGYQIGRGHLMFRYLQMPQQKGEPAVAGLPASPLPCSAQDLRGRAKSAPANITVFMKETT